MDSCAWLVVHSAFAGRPAQSGVGPYAAVTQDTILQGRNAHILHSVTSWLLQVWRCACLKAGVPSLYHTTHRLVQIFRRMNADRHPAINRPDHSELSLWKCEFSLRPARSRKSAFPSQSINRTLYLTSTMSMPLLEAVACVCSTSAAGNAMAGGQC